MLDGEGGEKRPLEFIIPDGFGFIGQKGNSIHKRNCTNFSIKIRGSMALLQESLPKDVGLMLKIIVICAVSPEAHKLAMGNR